MRNILEDLWFENINPYSDCKTKTSETDELEKYIERHKRNLSETMTDAQKETFEKLEDCYKELTEINERQIFTHAFSLGARMVLCILNEEN